MSANPEEDTRLIRRTITIEPALWDAMLNLAAERRSNASEQVREAIAEYLRRSGYLVDRVITVQLARPKTLPKDEEES